jgi:membrane protein DedA with SNARE-associated domain
VRYIDTHPFATILISRFIGFCTTAANFISGFIKMPLGTFLFADSISNCLCVALYLGIGYTVGRIWSHENLVSLTGIVILLSVALYGLVMIPLYIFREGSYTKTNT